MGHNNHNIKYINIIVMAMQLCALTPAVWAQSVFNDGGIDFGGVNSGTASASSGQQAVAGVLQAIQSTNGICSFGGFPTGSGSSVYCAMVNIVTNNLQPLVSGISIPPLYNGLFTQQLSTQSDINAQTISISSPQRFMDELNRQLQEREEKENNNGSASLNNLGSYGFIKTSYKPADETLAGGAGDDGYRFIGPLGMSISGSGGFGDVESNEGETGFDIDTYNFNAFLDYKFTDRLVSGISFGYERAERTLLLNSGSLDSDTYRVSPFIHFSPTENVYLNVLGGYGWLDFDSIRKTSPVTQQIDNVSTVLTKSDSRANFGADQYFGSLGAGYLHRTEGWTLHGYGRADYSHSFVDGYTEKDGVVATNDLNDPTTNRTGDLNLQVNGQRILSVTSTFGMEVSRAFSTNTLAAVVIPKLRAEWVHEYENGARDISSRLLLSSDPQFNSLDTNMVLRTASPERDWGNIGVNVQALFPHAVVGFVDYQALIMGDGSNNVFSVGARVDF